VLGRRLSQEAIDDGEAVEADDRGQATADGGPAQVALLLHPAGVELNVDPEHGEGLQADLGTPGEPSPQVAGVAGAGVARVAGQEPADGKAGFVEQRWTRDELGGC
jgi:hypothetical protein